MLSSGWVIGPHTEEGILSVINIQEQHGGGFDQFVVLKALKIYNKQPWEVYVLGHIFTKESTPVLEEMPSIINMKT